MKTILKSGAALTTVSLAAMTTPAMAYVGPGAGISLLGSIVGLLIALGTAVVVVVLLPLKALRKRRNKAADPAKKVTSQIPGE